jgi:UDP-N-acetylmuramate--alanine ligase
MQNHFQVAVTGAHGKTSTTAMSAAVLRAGGLDPTVVVGALWDHLGSNAVLGRGEYFVAEADESDGSFTFLTPQISVITNLDREHLDHYRDLAHIQATFAGYLQNLPPGARVVAWADDPYLAPVLATSPHELITYSLKPHTAAFYATDLSPQGSGYRFRLWRRGQALGTVKLPLTGSHYVLNAMAACAVGDLLGLDFPVWQQGLGNLGQIHRRCQIKGEARGILVMDDYGHHPTEIRSTLTGLAQAFPDRRLVVAFQPHRYTRTRALLPEFFPVFRQAEMVFITEIYGAGESRPDGLSGRAVYEGVCRTGHAGVHFIEENGGMADYILKHLSAGDMVLTLGAGDIWKTGEELLARLQNQAAAGKEGRP